MYQDHPILTLLPKGKKSGSTTTGSFCTGLAHF